MELFRIGSFQNSGTNMSGALEKEQPKETWGN